METLPCLVLHLILVNQELASRTEGLALDYFQTARNTQVWLKIWDEKGILAIHWWIVSTHLRAPLPQSKYDHEKYVTQENQMLIWSIDYIYAYMLRPEFKRNFQT